MAVQDELERTPAGGEYVAGSAHKSDSAGRLACPLYRARQAADCIFDEHTVGFEPQHRGTSALANTSDGGLQ